MADKPHVRFHDVVSFFGINEAGTGPTRQTGRTDFEGRRRVFGWCFVEKKTTLYRLLDINGPDRPETTNGPDRHENQFLESEVRRRVSHWCFVICTTLTSRNGPDPSQPDKRAEPS